MESAKAFDRILHDHWLRGDEAYSNAAIGRFAGVDEKHIRQWRSGEKRIPLASLTVIPSTVAIELVSWVSEARALPRQQRAIVALGEVVERLDAPVSPKDRDEVLRGLLEAQQRISARISKLATEGR